MSRLKEAELKLREYVSGLECENADLRSRVNQLRGELDIARSAHSQEIEARRKERDLFLQPIEEVVKRFVSVPLVVQFTEGQAGLFRMLEEERDKLRAELAQARERIAELEKNEDILDRIGMMFGGWNKYEDLQTVIASVTDDLYVALKSIGRLESVREAADYAIKNNARWDLLVDALDALSALDAGDCRGKDGEK